MSAQSSAQPPGSLLFRWERPRPRRFAIAGFLLASVGLHALCFYLFVVVYPPAISLLPPPAQVSVIAPTSSEARTFLNWLNAEDPALASQTQRPADARAFQLPKLQHVPSYLAVPPQLKESPPPQLTSSTPSAMPPAPVPRPPARNPAPPASRAYHPVFFRRAARPSSLAPRFKVSRVAPRSPRERALSDRGRFVRRGPLQFSGTILRRCRPR